MSLERALLITLILLIGSQEVWGFELENYKRTCGETKIIITKGTK